MKRRAAVLLAVSCLALLTLSSAASADTSICAAGAGAGKCENPQGLAVDFETGRLYVADQGNRRVSVFEPDGSFAFAFGWGVADGAAELQSCGPAATPPTAGCLKGLASGGAGAFSSLGDIAVDNDPTSPSFHDVYVYDGNQFEGGRIQKFDPEGNFLLTWGGGVITGGASGTGDLASGSNQITAVKTTSKQFATGQTITGAGIPAETKILALGAETITLSKAATASGTAVALSVAAGTGNKPINETQVLTIEQANPNFPVGELFFSTPSPSTNQASVQFNVVDPPPASGPGSLQEALEGMANIGAGNVAVSGPTGGPYTIEFKGTRFVDTDVNQISYGGSGTVPVITTQNGGGAAEICTAAIAVSCSAGIEGDGQGQFAESLHLAVGPGGVVHVPDCVGDSGQANCKNRLQKFEPSGDFIEELALPQTGSVPEGFAVDSGGDFYVSVNDALRKYGATGNLLKALPIAGGVGALAIDASDHLFAAELDEGGLGSGPPVIAEYDPTGDTVRRFGYGVLKSRPSGLAPHISATGDIYSAENDGVIHRAFPPPGPIIAPGPCKAGPLGNFKATLNAEINPEGKATGFKFEYLTDDQFKSGGFSNPETKTSEEVVLSQVDFFLHKASIQVTGLQPETTYHCRVVAENADSATPVVGDEGSFETKEGFEFGSAWASEVGEEEATVKVEGNPLGIPATGQIEYVSDAKYKVSGFAEALSAPEGELDFGASEAMQLRSATLSGLTPGTLYHYRLRARNGTPPAGIICPEQKPICPELERTFKTYLPEASEADQRRWELVSPAQKNSAEVAVPGNSAGFIEVRFIRILAASTSGEAATYTSWTSFGDAEGAQGTSQYLSKRTDEGWLTENIAPKGFLWSPLQPPYVGFSPDLRYGAFRTTAPVLVEGCLEGLETLYLRDNETGGLHCLTPDLPGAPQQPCPVYAGLSADGSRAFFAGKPEGAENFEYGLYEWTKADGEVHLVSVLPNGDPAPATNGTSFGAAGDRFSGASNCDVTRRVMRHVVSEDGSRAFWTAAPNDESKPTQLYARIDGTDTIQLDVKQPSGAAAGNGVFRAASADGSVVYFTDAEKLISGSKAEAGKPDLYSYQLGLKNPLTDLTKGAEPGDVKGLVGISDDGAYVYFVAGAVLSEEANKAGQKAEAGKNNLYLHHEGKTSFIATLAGEDGGDWVANPREMSARVSPDGKSLAFLSVAAKKLAGYDNTIAAGEHCQYNSNNDGKVKLFGSPLCPQAFLYAADSGELRCASCNPSGSRPLGPTVLPGWTNGYEGPRFLSDDGSRLFFQSFDELLPADENGMGDVYEFELEGKGSCDALNPNFDPASGGCHFLLSGGKSEDETFLVDASADGRDVFFSTREQLVGWDDNDNYDVYDYRAGGGFPEPPPPSPICKGEGCLPPPPSTSPPGSSPATATFQGPGNAAKPRSTRCPKGKVRRKARCVKRQGKARKRGQRKGVRRRANDQGRAAR